MAGMPQRERAAHSITEHITNRGVFTCVSFALFRNFTCILGWVRCVESRSRLTFFEENVE
jgi:hypothetical protein